MNEQEDLEELKKKIVIERLRQAPPNVKVSFGMSNGKFMERDELIKNVEENTEIGNKIIKIQLNYLKAFKEGFLINK
jgi:hypothetical protein